MEGRLLRKRFSRRITILAVSLSIVILLMGGLLLFLSSGVRDAWTAYSYTSESRATALSELHRSIGYGGFIHNFKNYVLRQEQSLLERLSGDIEKSSQVISLYSALELNSKESQALLVIQQTLQMYRDNLRVAQMAVKRGTPTQQIDKQVRIDDKPALAALAVLQLENNRFHEAVTRDMNKQITNLINVLLVGLLAMPFVVLAAYHYHDVMNRFVLLIAEKREVEKALVDSTAEVEEAQQQRRAMAYEAHHCELTRVPNRKAFMSTGYEIMQDAAARKACLTVLFVDVDDFKTINDTYGHEIGDKVLVEVASRLSVALREGDFVARIGGDEFAMIIQCNDTATCAPGLAERLLDVMNESYADIAEDLEVSCSVGGANCPQDGQDLETLVRVADERMYRVKKSGKNGVFLQEA
ncbi:GGDEF domain-containing protein [Neptuniibacter sp. PT8_73]|uniref:GGDEF domain-containing protein n=1 Tax=unclassified Neptuniibacter TaxID=2630693 RepID=UPI0039F70518